MAPFTLQNLYTYWGAHSGLLKDLIKILQRLIFFGEGLSSSPVAVVSAKAPQPAPVFTCVCCWAVLTCKQHTTVVSYSVSNREVFMSLWSWGFLWSFLHPQVLCFMSVTWPQAHLNICLIIWSTGLFLSMSSLHTVFAAENVEPAKLNNLQISMCTQSAESILVFLQLYFHTPS